MLCENGQVKARLAGMVQRVTTDPWLREELMQEALIRLWEFEVEGPDGTESFYVQGCQFRVINYLKQGRSLDAAKRRCLGCPIDDVLGEGDCPVPACLVSGSDPSQEASLTDLLEEMERRLEVREIEVLWFLRQGYRELEIARRLGISHTMVRKRRERIAAVLRQVCAEGRV